MRYLLNTFIILTALFFSACASKEELNINKNIISFSLDKNITIINAPKTVKSPVSFGLGVGSQIARHVGISVGTSIRPNLSNDDALVLQRSLSLHNISLKNIIRNEFTNQMRNDDKYKDKFVSFGSNYVIHILVPKYTLETSILSSKAQTQITIQVQILNKNAKVVYEDTQENSLKNENYSYERDMIINNASFLEKSVQKAVSLTISKLIKEMKEN